MHENLDIQKGMSHHEREIICKTSVDDSRREVEGTTEP